MAIIKKTSTKEQKIKIGKEQKLKVASSSAYTIYHRGKPSRGAVLIRNLRSPKEMVILHTILSPPKSLL